MRTSREEIPRTVPELGRMTFSVTGLLALCCILFLSIPNPGSAQELSPEAKEGPEQRDTNPNQDPTTNRGGGPSEPPTVALFLEPIPGLTTLRREIPGGSSLPLTANTHLTMRMVATGTGAERISYRWETALETSDSGGHSTADFLSHRPGPFTVRVTPSLDGVAWEPISVRINVYRIHPKRIRVKIADPPGHVTFVGNPFRCHAVTDPPEFVNLIEWGAPDHEPSSGIGAEFVTRRHVVGDRHPIVASLAATPSPPATHVMV